MAARRAIWPLARGFDRWYGFHGGETHQFVPALYHDNHSVAPPRSIEDGYHLSADLADRAIEFLGDLRAVDADRPFFLYFCTGACHSPHHAPREWIERYRGHFDEGWDALARGDLRPPARHRRAAPGHRAVAAPALGAGLGRPAEPRSRRVAARFMECFAAFLSYTDAQIGRLLALPRADRRRSTTPSSSWCPTTAPAPRAAPTGRSTTAGCINFDPAGPRRDVAAHRRDRRPARPQQLPVGLDHGRQHALQAVEARGPRRRGRRPLHRAAGRPGWAPAAAASAASSPTPSTSCRPCSSWSAWSAPAEIDDVPQTPLDGISFASLLGAGGAEPPGTAPPSTSRCSGAGPSTTRAGRR